MARGDLTVFDEYTLELGNATHNMSATHVFKCALIDTVPVGTENNPGFAAGATTNYSTNEVSGGTYASKTLTWDTATRWTESASGTATFDADSFATGEDGPWAQDGSGPTTIRAALIYNDSATDKNAVCFIDLTTDGSTAISTQNGDISITFHANGLFTVNV